MRFHNFNSGDIIRRGKCKIDGCIGGGLTVVGAYASLCDKHNNICRLICSVCGAERKLECAYGFSIPRWHTICGGRFCNDGQKHKWIERVNMTLLNGKNVCKSCGFIGCDDDPDLCMNPKSKNFKKLMAWESGEGCRDWVHWRKS